VKDASGLSLATRDNQGSQIRVERVSFLALIFKILKLSFGLCLWNRAGCQQKQRCLKSWSCSILIRDARMSVAILLHRAIAEEVPCKGGRERERA